MTDVSENRGDDSSQIEAEGHEEFNFPVINFIGSVLDWTFSLTKIGWLVLTGLLRPQVMWTLVKMLCSKDLWLSGLQLLGIGIDARLKRGLRRIAGSALPRSPTDDRPLLYAYGCAAAEVHLEEARHQRYIGLKRKRREHLLLTLTEIPGQRVPWQEDAAYLKGFCDTLSRNGVTARYRIFYRCEEVKLKRLATLVTRKGTAHKLYAQICLPLEPESWLKWSLLPNLWPQPPEPEMATA